ncbi:hypothetical protein ACUXST_002346 [Sphingomonas sp. F9_3S_D5_B_2]
MVFGLADGVKWTAVASAALLLCAPAPASAQPPLTEPGFLTIGLTCRWDSQCIHVQRKAMKKALGFVRKEHPPAWKVQLCNRNAGRGYQRVDWLGFDHCIRNASLAAPPPVRVRQMQHRQARR